MISHDRLLLLRLCFPPFVVVVGIIALYTTYLHKHAKVASLMYIALKLVRRLLLRPAEVNLTLYRRTKHTSLATPKKNCGGGRRAASTTTTRHSPIVVMSSVLLFGMGFT